MRRPSRLLLRDRVYVVLVRAIVDGDLQPGTPIRDQELAVQLGLSRTPVREALARLADEGLVVTKPNAYTRVAAIDADAARDAAVLNQTLHGLAARLASTGGRFTAEHAAAARAANDRFAESLRAGDLPDALGADDELHALFVDAADNAQLELAIDRLAPLLRRYALARFGSLPGRRSIRTHAQLIDAAERGAVERAGALAEENWGALVALVDSTGGTDRAAR